ncbi:DgyrCDS4229 [Dimorphilus gyrociliatus]|uniref:DgyrCDS4229 n=1 Tax=Dimorphilus gyrociliatus TaxID=2664684 RepID=A0A7I8VHS9_9ANNE|nr:DgyrCDS4229 [Dimorphilus gyrociliatus]
MQSPELGTFWVNRTTGEKQEDVPDHVIRAIKSIDEKDNELDLVKNENERLRLDLKEKKSCIELLETSERQLRLELDELLTKLNRAESNNDKLRTDNKKKTESTDKMEFEYKKMEDKVIKLEAKGMKYSLFIDLIYISLIFRNGIRFNEANLRLKNQDYKILDLKAQVREELFRNDKIDQKLARIPILEDEIQEKNNEIERLKNESKNKDLLLQHSRLSNREYRENVKRLENNLNEQNSQQEELERAKLEINTLRRLLAGKDSLLRKMNGQAERSLLKEIDENAEPRPSTNQNTYIETSVSDRKSESLLETLLSDENKKDARCSRPKTASDSKLDTAKLKKIRIKSAPHRANAQRISLPNSPYEQLGLLNSPPGSRPNPARSPPLSSRLIRADKERLKFFTIGDKVTANIRGKPVIKEACVAFIGYVEPKNYRTHIGIVLSEPGKLCFVIYHIYKHTNFNP